MMRVGWSFALAVGLVLGAFTRSDAAWPYKSGLGPDAWGYAVAVDKYNDRALVAGSLTSTGKVGVVKLTAGSTGGTVAAKKDNYAGTGQAYGVVVDNMFDASPTSAGNVVIAGSQDLGTGNGLDFMVARLDGGLAEYWGGPTRYNGTANPSWDEAYDVVVNTSKQIFAAGQVENTSVGLQLFVAKVDKTTGAFTWTYTAGASGLVDDWAEAVAEQSGRVAAAGARGTSPWSFWVVDLIDNGSSQTLSWDYRCSTTTASVANDVDFDASGDLFAVGSYGSKFYVVKLKAAHSLTTNCGLGSGEWEDKSLSGRADNVAIDGSGNAYVVGMDSSNITRLRKYSSAGTLGWDKIVLGGTCPVRGCDVVVDGAGNIAVTGERSGQVFVRRWNSAGTQLADQDITNGGGTGIAFDSANASIVSGGDTADGMIGGRVP
jgi:hypothetical protein